MLLTDVCCQNMFRLSRNGIFIFILILSKPLTVPAGSESALSDNLSVPGYKDLTIGGVIKPHLQLLHHNEKESFHAMKWRLLGMNKKETETTVAQNPAPASNSASDNIRTALPDLNHKWQSLLPFFGAGAEKKGYKLPYAIGVIPGFYFGKRHIKVSNTQVTIAGFTIPADRLAKVKVKSREKNWSLRIDSWIFPFLSVYALGGYTRQYTDAAISIGFIDRMSRRRGMGKKAYSMHVDLTGVTYGGGITMVGGYKNYFAALDTNYTISALNGDLIFGNRLNPEVRALLCSMRVGWRKQFGVSHMNLWVGETYWDTANTITGTPEIPVLGTVGFSLKESTIKPWSTHMGTHIEVTKTFQFILDLGTNFAGLFCITPAFMYRF